MPADLTTENGLPVILDVEASGFGRGSYPIEIGLAFPDGHTECYLIRPFSDWRHWDTRAEAVHGISPETLRDTGLDPVEVAQVLNEHLAGRIVYSDGWSFDNAWVAQLYDRAGLFQRFRIDTLRKLIDESQLTGWQQAKKAVIEELGLRRHRASSDALILLKTISRLLPDLRMPGTGARR